MASSPLERFRVPLNLSAWITFAIALSLYWTTVDPRASYWDCAEYITAASKLEVTHPPGNPIWMLAMRVATIPFPSSRHAIVINLCSGLFMAFAAFWLCKIIFIFTSLYFFKSLSLKSSHLLQNSKILYSAISIGSSLCFALCDSTWFSAVEAEVYAMSTFLSALSLWLMVRWWFEKDKAAAKRLLLLVAYITGVSLGVHQLNLLLIPLFLLIALYRKHPPRLNPVLPLVVTGCGIAIIGIILMGLIPGLLYVGESFELFFVNKLGSPYDTGLIVSALLLFILLVIAIILTNKIPSLHNMAMGVYYIAFIFIGFSSYGVIMVRAKASPPMNEGSPDNIFALASYISREQYPSAPLLFGETPYSRPIFEESIVNGRYVYSKYLLNKEHPIFIPVSPGARLNHRSLMLTPEDSMENRRILNLEHGYLLSDYKFSQILTPELNMWFPRMTSRNINDRMAYEGWAGMKQSAMHRIPVSETMDAKGVFRTKMSEFGGRPDVFSYKPTYSQNFRFFTSYQAYYMYFRYLFWNFIGRQNDFPSQGEVEHGNFITGIPMFDRFLPGMKQPLPSELGSENKGRNRYFGIPFLLGILGIIWLISMKRKQRRICSLIALLFFMTGLAIVIYLNQSPGEPRERDYTFLVSYMAFSMWIAAGISSISRAVLKRVRLKPAIIICSAIALAPATLMALENFDDHNRSGRYETTFFASSLLDFEYPSIIFSHGDNSTFPLWYVSEVLERGSRHSVIDVTYLSLPNYVVNLKKQKPGLTTIATIPEIAYGKYLLTRIPSDSISRPMPLTKALKSLYASQQPYPRFPSSLISIPASNGDSLVINLHHFSGGSSYLSFKHLMLLDILASNLESEQPKALFFPHLLEHSLYAPIQSLLHPALFGKIYAPGLTDSMVTDLMANSLRKELKKLDVQNIQPHYMEPVVADMAIRYRGELIVAANYLMERGDTALPLKISEYIDRYYNYDSLLPGSFTMGDSTFYEGKEFIKLLNSLHEATGKKEYQEKAQKLDSTFNSRRMEWMIWYKSLSPSERATLSNRTKRILIN